MRTYYIHGKITPTAFHLRANLLKKPPPGYYYINELTAVSQHQAIRMIVEQNHLHPPSGREVSLNLSPEAQSTFIKEP